MSGVGARRGGALATAVAMLLGLMVACGGSSDTDDVVYAPPRLPTSVADSAVTPTTAPATVGGGGPVTTRGPRSGGAPGTDAAALPAGTDPGSSGYAPPVAGTYRYDTSGVSTFGLTSLPYPPTSTLVVDPPDGTRQHWTRDLRDAAGNGPITEFALDFRPDGVFLEDLKFTNTFSGMVNVQDLRPPSPALLVPTGAGVGSHSEFDLASPDGGTARAVVDVTGQEPVAVGNGTVDTLIVRTVVTLSPGEVSGGVELTGWFAPGARVWAKERFVANAAVAGGLFLFHSEYDATAQRLTPS